MTYRTPLHVTVIALDEGAQPFVQETILVIRVVLIREFLLPVTDVVVAESFSATARGVCANARTSGVTEVMFNQLVELMVQGRPVPRLPGQYAAMFLTSYPGAPPFVLPGCTRALAAVSLVSSAYFASMDIAMRLQAVAMVAAHELGHVAMEGGNEIHCLDPSCVFRAGTLSVAENHDRIQRAGQWGVNAYCNVCLLKARALITKGRTL